MLKVKVKNFQSITNVDFDIDGFTVIVGKNNKGKSALVRSIDSALSNRLGNNFIQWGKTETQVNIKRDALDITWVKGDSASYKINDKEYTSLKGAVPQPIIDAGFKKIEISDEKINPLVAHQFEELFLINKTGSFITETLSTLYDLNTINEADNICQKRIKTNKTLLKTRTADITILKNRLNKFQGFEELKSKYEELKISQNKIKTLTAEITLLENLYAQLLSQVTLIKKLQNIKDIKIPDIANLNNRIYDLSWLTSIEIEYNDLNNLTKKLSLAGTLKIPDVQYLQTDVENSKWLNNIFEKFSSVVSCINKLKPIKNLLIPVLNTTQELLLETQNISKITEELKTTVLLCNRYKKALINQPKFNILIDKIKKVAFFINDLKDLDMNTEDYNSLVKIIDDTNFQLSQTKTILEETEKQKSSFKFCPLCKSPLAEKCNHG